MAPADPPHPKVPPRFELRDLLGQGGMAVVRVAYDHALRRQVAVKTLRPGRDSPALVDRFVHEAQVTAQLEHPSIVPLYDFGKDARGNPHIAMKRVRGRSMEELIADGDWNDRSVRLGAFERVCEAIAYAHAQGVIHRDLKTANVMVGAFGEVLVMDWGLAKVLGGPALAPVVHTTRDESESNQTRYGQAAGTPACMPPEQARGELDRIGPGADVYALGALLFELLTGERLREGTAQDALEAARAGTRRPTPRTLPRELRAILDRALQNEPEHRYASPLEMAEDVRAWQLGQPVSVVRYGPAALALKWMVRHAGPVAAVASVVMVAMLVGAISLVGYTALLAVARDHALDESLRAQAAEQQALLRLSEAELAQGRAATLDDPAAARAHLETAATLALQLDRDPRSALFAAADVAHRHPPPLVRLPEVEVSKLATHGGRVLTREGEDVVLRALPSLSEVQRRVGALGMGWHEEAPLVFLPGPEGLVLERMDGTVLGHTGIPVNTDELQLSGRGEIFGVREGRLGRWTLEGQPLWVPQASTFSSVSEDGGLVVAKVPSEDTVEVWNLDRRVRLAASKRAAVTATHIAVYQDDWLELRDRDTGAVLWRADEVPPLGWLIANEEVVAGGGYERASWVWSVENGTPRAVATTAARQGAWAAGLGALLVSTDTGLALWPNVRVPFHRLESGVVGSGLALSGDGVLLAVAGEEGRVVVYEALARRKLIVARGPSDGFRDLNFTADAQELQLAGRDGQIHRLALATGEWLPALQTAEDLVTSVVSLDNGRTVYAGISGTVHLGDARLPAHEGPVWNLSALGGRILSTGRGEAGGVGLWDSDTGRQVRWFEAPGPLYRGALHPRGWAAVGTHTGEMLLWPPEDAGPVRSLRGHEGPLLGVAFSESLIASVGYDRKLRLWGLDAEAPLHELGIHRMPGVDLAFSPDGRFVYALGAEGSVVVLDLALDTVLGGAGLPESLWARGRVNEALELLDTATASPAQGAFVALHRGVGVAAAFEAWAAAGLLPGSAAAIQAFWGATTGPGYGEGAGPSQPVQRTGAPLAPRQR